MTRTTRHAPPTLPDVTAQSLHERAQFLTGTGYRRRIPILGHGGGILLPCRARRFQAPRHPLWREQSWLTSRKTAYMLSLRLSAATSLHDRVFVRNSHCLLLASGKACATAIGRWPATLSGRAAGEAGQDGHRPRGDTFDSSQDAREPMDVRSHRPLRSLAETPRRQAREDAVFSSLLDRPVVTQLTTAVDSWAAHRRRCAVRFPCQWAPLAITG